MAKQTFSAEDRRFLELVEVAAFSNPFGAERHALDNRIAGVAVAPAADQLLRQVMEAVRAKLAELERQGRADIRLYEDRDRELCGYLVLFDVFHRFQLQFDGLIAQQIEVGDDSVQVAFAAEVLASLEKAGFTTPRAERLFAIFFQLRRAYYFISRHLAGKAPCMVELKCRVWASIFTCNPLLYEQLFWCRMEDFSTLILGETGSGKGAVAAAIGRSGFIPFDRAKKRFTESFTANFLAINLAQFPEALLESELFGHRKGSFTGAVEHRDGVFARCQPLGVIFIDEVGDIPVHVQTKLLRVLQERVYSEVGGQTNRRFSGRILAATNKPVDELRRSGVFRDDFYYRLSADVLIIPTLRQRLQEDSAELELLLATVVRQVVGEPAAEVVALVHRVLRADLPSDYQWLGNVRELEQAVRRIILNGHYYGEQPRPVDAAAALAGQLEAGQLTAHQLLGSYCRSLYARLGTMEAVAQRLDLDARTVKRHLLEGPKP